MNLKAFGKIVANFGANFIGIGSIFAAQTPSTKDDIALAKISNFFVDAVGVIESVQTFGEVLGTPGTDKARAAGPQFGILFTRSYKAAGFDMDKDKEEKFKAACAAAAGAFADVRDCFKKD